jgi:hypothetical protein
MIEYLKRGDAVAFLGAPHIQGVSKWLLAAGYQVKGPAVTTGDRRGKPGDPV